MILGLICIPFLVANPAFAANANLFVSAENSQFDNYMSGPQVIEVLVTAGSTEPDVTVNGKILRMVQAIDDNWYGYFADNTLANIADGTSQSEGNGLDFGEICSVSSAGTSIGNSTSFFDNSNGAAVIAINTSCGSQAGYNSTIINVLRETKAPNEASPNLGRIGINDGSWPFIQLYNLSQGGNVVVQYNKGGGAQTTTLTFDVTDQFAGFELDKTNYSVNQNVLLTITDLWLNIDPTDEDSWTFGTSGTNSTNYQIFDKDGNQAGDAVGGVYDISSVLEDLMCGDNCVFKINPDIQNSGFVITLQDNDDSEITATAGSSNPQIPYDWETAGGFVSGNVPITITENATNSGIFESFDESNRSSITITNAADNGSSASFDYNKISTTIFVIPPPICQVPNNDDWTITSDCTLQSNASAPQNVIVQNNSLLTIPNGVFLDVDFANFNLTIKSGSGVLIKAGGTIT